MSNFFRQQEVYLGRSRSVRRNGQRRANMCECREGYFPASGAFSQKIFQGLCSQQRNPIWDPGAWGQPYGAWCLQFCWLGVVTHLAKQPSIPEKWVSTWLYRTLYPPFILLNAWDLGWKAWGPVITWSSSCDLRKAIPEGVAQSIVTWLGGASCSSLLSQIQNILEKKVAEMFPSARRWLAAQLELGITPGNSGGWWVTREVSNLFLYQEQYGYRFASAHLYFGQVFLRVGVSCSVCQVLSLSWGPSSRSGISSLSSHLDNTGYS